MLAAHAAVMRKMDATIHRSGLRGRHRGVIVMTKRARVRLMTHRRALADSMRGFAFHGDGRERLNRKAQHEQHDNEEFAPVRHGSGV